MAQIMYYYRAQSVSATTAEIPAYTTSSYGISVSATPAGSPIDWGNMTNTYSSSATDEQKAAVAALMAYCGCSVQMNYGPSSGAVSAYVSAALENYFGYATGGKYINRSIYTLQEWENMVYEELLAKRPLFYSGQSSGGGHAFIVDGYDGDGLFHFNWGWGGSSDGYFLLQVANPGNNSGIGASSSSDGYARSQGAIFGVNPSSLENAIPLTPTTYFTAVGDNSISIRFWNIAGEDVTLTLNMGVGYVNENGKLTHLTGNYYGSLGYTSLYNLSFTIDANTFSTAGLPAGTYILKPMCKVNGASEWIEPTARYFNEYVIAVYDGTTVTLTLHQNTPQLSVTAFEYPKGTAPGSVAVKTTVENTGDEYTGYLYLFASTTTDKGSSIANSYATIETGKTTAAQFTPELSTAGTYNIWIATDSNGENVIGQTQVEITNTGAVTYNLTAQGISLENGNNVGDYGGTIYGTHIKGRVLLKNEGTTTYDDEIGVQLYKHKQGYIYGSADKQTIATTIAVGETKSVDFDFSNQDHTSYLINIMYGDGTRIKMYNYNGYTLAPGVEITSADGATSAVAATSSVTVPSNAVAVNLVGVANTVTSVTPNSNPNTLYYIGESETVPSGLSNSNLVKGATATEIVLTEGYNFIIPTTFTANSIKYKMMPTTGTNGTGGWTTISLPFDVTSVTADGAAIDWFHSKEETGKNFWLRQFVGIDGNTVMFGDAERMEANVPYIVAFPTDRWGAEYNLVGKNIIFHGENAMLVADALMRLVTSKANFEGTTTTNQVEDSYLLNAAGTTFELGNGEVSPFQAYFKPKGETTLAAKLAIKFVDDDDVTGITNLQTEDGNSVATVYTLSGTQIGTVRILNGKPQIESLPKGVYVINGKKIIR